MAQKIEIYNSLSKRSEKPVKELIGSHAKSIKLLLETLEYSDDEPFVMFQVSGTFQSTSTNPKYVNPEDGDTGNNDEGNYSPNITKWGDKYPKIDKNDSTYEGLGWITVKAPLSAIPDLIKQGYTLRYGIKEGGNSKDHFVGCQFLAFDLDNESNLLSIEKTLEICYNFGINPFVIYYSPSGSPEFPKLRLVIRLDEFCDDYDRLFILLVRIYNVFPNASITLPDPVRFFYGTLKPEDLQVWMDDRSVNNIEHLEAWLPDLNEEDLKKIKENFEKKLSLDSTENDRSTVNKRFVEHLKNHVIIPQFDGDPTRLVDHWINWINANVEGSNLHSGEWFDRGSQNGSLNSWNGTDPIKGSTTGKGDSFVISIQQDGTITFSVNHGSFGGDLVDLFYYLHAGSWDVAKQTKTNWRSSITKLCCVVHEIDDFNEQDKQEQQQIFKLNDGDFRIFYQSKKNQKIATSRVILDPDNFARIFYQDISDYAYRFGSFYRWMGTHWQKEEEGQVRKMIEDAFNDVTSKDGNYFPLAHSDIGNSAMKALKNSLFVPSNWENPHPCAINCKNGILLLHGKENDGECELIPHDKRYWFTSKPLVNWNQEADCTLADQMLFSVKEDHLETFLRTLSIGLDVNGYIRRFGRPRSLLPNGEGMNGKDILRQGLQRILGAFGNASLDDFAEQSSTNKKFNLARLAQYKINWCSENNSNVSLARLKSLINAISGGKHEAERKGKDAETVTVRSLFVFNLNKLPVFNTTEQFILSRFCIVDFDKVFAKEPKQGEYPANPRFDSDPDENPDDEYMNTACEGLLLRLIQAWQRMYRDGGIDWSASDERIKELAIQANQFDRFLYTINAKKNPKHRILSPRLYALYQAVQIMEGRASANWCITTEGAKIDPEDLTTEDILKIESVVNFHGIVEDEKIKSEKPIENQATFIRELKRVNRNKGLGSQTKEIENRKKLSYVVGLEIEGVSELID